MSGYVRIIPELRAAHVERTQDWGEGETVLYRHLKWDLASDGSIPDNCRKLTFVSLRQSCASPGLLVELPEPLWVRELPWTILTMLGFLLVTLGRVRFVVYAIENNELRTLLGSGRLSVALKWTIGLIFGSLLTRIAFGSEAARRTYEELPFLSRVERRVILELPAPRLTAAGVREQAGALFVGRLEERKGVRQLLRSWVEIEKCLQTRLTLVGSGPLAGEVIPWVAARPISRRHVPQVAHEDLERFYGAHTVLVAPSLRQGRWREQIGLPIKEALSMGMTVVTTPDTGLAPWLADHGHEVVDLDDLDAAIARALRDPLPRSGVLSSLPAVDGRRSANDWLKDARI